MKNPSKRPNVSSVRTSSTSTSSASGQKVRKPLLKPGQNGENSPLPPPKLTPEQSFMIRLEGIFTGARTDPAQSFEPLNDLYDLKTPCQNEFGVLKDTMAKELYSLAASLAENVRHLAAPRKPDQVERYNKESGILQEQCKLACELFWQRVKASMPELSNTDRPLLLGKGWLIGIGDDTPGSESFGSLIISGVPMYTALKIVGHVP